MSQGKGFDGKMKNERVRLQHSNSKAKRHRRLVEDRNSVGARAVRKVTRQLRFNAKCAVELWGELSAVALYALQGLISRHPLSIAAGDLQLLNGKWYVTHSGLLRMASHSRCSAITTSIDKTASDPGNNRWVFRATVYKSPRSRGFVGYGDTDPSNVSSLVHGAEMRVAETRAVNRALRKAYGIGLSSVEELGWAPRSNASGSSEYHKAATNGNTSQQNGQPRLRDRLCLLIRQHKLDAGLVKAYAADYCGTPTLRDARRDQVEAFINDLAERATKDRDGLICQLNSYSKSQEVAP